MKVKNKYLILIFLLVMFITSFFNVKAETFQGKMALGSWIPVYLVKTDENGRNGGYLQGRFILRQDDGAFLYCLQPFVEFDPSKANQYEVIKEEYARVLSLSDEDWERISLLAYYGYGYGSHTESKWYMITQVMIWKTVEPNASFHYTNTLNGVKNDNLFVSETQEIENLVQQHTTRPSFDGNSINLNIGESTTLTDSNNVLEKFSVTEHSSNIDVKKEGNNLTITALSSGSASIVLKNKSDGGTIPPVVYVKDTLQDVFSRGAYDPVSSTLRININGGGFNLHKIDNKGNSLAGVKFGVFNEGGEQVCTIITDGDGNGTCDDLPLGSYIVRELETIEGYVKNENSYSFEITTSNTSPSLEIENKKITGFIEIYKIDKENNSATTQGDAKLKGAVYGIYDSKGTKVDELVTDEYGYDKSIELEYGEYTIRELRPSEGYIIDTNTYHANINKDGIVIKTTSKEQVIKFDFSMLKVESDGRSGIIEAEPNAVFNIFLKSKNSLAGTITTDNEGKAKITLPYGVYNVCQVKGSDEAELTPCFEINISTGDVHKIVNNGLVSARLKVIKVDQDNNELPISGIRFKIKDLSTNEYVCQTVSYPNKVTYCEFETNEDGILITPFPLDAGDYELEEVDQVIYGYLWNSNPLKFSIKTNTSYDYDEELGAIIEVRFNNNEVKGKVVVNKVGEKPVIENNRFTYVEVPLNNAVFKIIADEDIIISGRLYYSKGDFVGRIDLKNTNELVDLPLGKYLLIEEKTDENHILVTDPIPFELKYKDQYTPEIVVEINVKNYYKKGDFDFSKVDLVDGTPIPDTDIKIYTENDELVFEGTTDSNGHILIKDLPVNVKLYLVETKANEKYRLSDEKIYFMIKENGEVVKGVMTNEKITSIIKLVKLDDHGHPVKGAVYELYNSAGELMGTYETDRKGRIEVELPYDDYYWKEVKTLKHLVLNTDLIPFKVRVDGEVIKLKAINKTIRSKVKLYKTDDKGVPQKGIKYNLYDRWDNYLGTYETDENGYIEVELEYGKYYWKEIETLENLVLNTEEIPFVVDADGEVIKLSAVNDIIRSKVKLYKTDDKGVPQKGIKYNLYDKDNNLLGTYETDENGYIEVELEYGEYYWLEVETLENLVLNTEKISFIVDTDGEVIEFSAVNDIIRSKVKLHKTDENGNPLVGVKFELYDINDNFLGLYTTDENGDIELELEYGYYYWQEVETLEHYELNTEKQYFEITEDGKVIEFTMVNIRVPDTQIKDNRTIELIGIIAITIGIGEFIYEFNKEKRKDKKKK